MKPTVVNETNIGKVIFKLLKESGRTKVDLSNKCKISMQTIFNWTIDKQYPRINMLCYFLDELGYKLIIAKKDKDINSEDLK